jgi:hypothetical protein
MEVNFNYKGSRKQNGVSCSDPPHRQSRPDTTRNLLENKTLKAREEQIIKAK